MTKCYNTNSIIPYWTYKVLFRYPQTEQKRESGESPERSGHCNRGTTSRNPIASSARCEKGRWSDDPEVRKPALYARLSFRVKHNGLSWNSWQYFRISCLLSARAGIFLWDFCIVHDELYVFLYRYQFGGAYLPSGLIPKMSIEYRTVRCWYFL